MKKPSPLPTRAPHVLVYLRISKADPTEAYLGIDAQRSACMAFVTGQALPLLGEFVDEGVSGADPLDKRPGLTRLLSSLCQGDRVLVAKRDRLARDAMLAAFIERAIQTAGATLYSAAGEGNGDDPASQLMKTIVDGFAQYERSSISARTKAALREKRNRGEKLGGMVPYGFKLASDGKHLELHEEETKTIQLARSMWASQMTLWAIAKKLAEQGRVARSGKMFGTKQILRMVAV